MIPGDWIAVARLQKAEPRVWRWCCWWRHQRLEWSCQWRRRRRFDRRGGRRRRRHRGNGRCWSATSRGRWGPTASPSHQGIPSVAAAQNPPSPVPTPPSRRSRRGHSARCSMALVSWRKNPNWGGAWSEADCEFTAVKEVIGEGEDWGGYANSRKFGEPPKSNYSFYNCSLQNQGSDKIKFLLLLV